MTELLTEETSAELRRLLTCGVVQEPLRSLVWSALATIAHREARIEQLEEAPALAFQAGERQAAIDNEIVAARALIAAGTQGSLRVGRDDHGSTVRLEDGALIACFDHVGSGRDEADAKLFVATRAGWSAALDEIEKLRAERRLDGAILRSVNDAIGRAGIHGMITFAEAIDQIVSDSERLVSERNASRAELTRSSPVVEAVKQWRRLLTHTALAAYVPHTALVEALDALAKGQG